MVHAKYSDKFHEYLRVKSKYYYKPNVKSLHYFSKKLNITRQQLIDKYGEHVFMDDALTVKVRDELREIVEKQKLEKSQKLHQENFNKFILGTAIKIKKENEETQ